MSKKPLKTKKQKPAAPKKTVVLFALDGEGQTSRSTVHRRRRGSID
jgi:hypothetical protein